MEQTEISSWNLVQAQSKTILRSTKPKKGTLRIVTSIKLQPTRTILYKLSKTTLIVSHTIPITTLSTTTSLI